MNGEKGYMHSEDVVYFHNFQVPIMWIMQKMRYVYIHHPQLYHQPKGVQSSGFIIVISILFFERPREGTVEL
jgi:hypothetical protein